MLELHLPKLAWRCRRQRKGHKRWNRQLEHQNMELVQRADERGLSEFGQAWPVPPHQEHPQDQAARRGEQQRKYRYRRECGKQFEQVAAESVWRCQQCRSDASAAAPHPSTAAYEQYAREWLAYWPDTQPELSELDCDPPQEVIRVVVDWQHGNEGGEEEKGPAVARVSGKETAKRNLDQGLNRFTAEQSLIPRVHFRVLIRRGLASSWQRHVGLLVSRLAKTTRYSAWRLDQPNTGKCVKINIFLTVLFDRKIGLMFWAQTLTGALCRFWRRTRSLAKKSCRTHMWVS